MTVLLRQKTPSGNHRTCNNICHIARTKRCRCICKGALHGILHGGANDETLDGTTPATDQQILNAAAQLIGALQLSTQLHLCEETTSLVPTSDENRA